MLHVGCKTGNLSVVVGRNLDNLNLDMWSFWGRPRAASAPRSWAPVVARTDVDPSGTSIALVSDSADYAEERVRTAPRRDLAL